MILNLLTLQLGLAAIYALIPTNRHTLIRLFGLTASMLSLPYSLYIWLQFDASGHGLQHICSLSSLSWLGTPLAFGLDATSLSLTVLTCALMPLCIILMRTKVGIMSMLALQPMLIAAINTIDLLGFYITFESSLIILYLLIARIPYGSLQAAYKITLYTAIGSLVYLPAVMLLYLDCGSTNVIELICINNTNTTKQTLIGTMLLLVFAIKVPLIPVHLWLPEAHVAAPTAGSILLAGVLLKLGTIGIIRLLLPIMSTYLTSITPILVTVCLVSYLYASLSTIRQVDLKTIIAYSSIAHMALIMLAVFTVSEVGIIGASFMMIGHGIVSPALFLLIGCIYSRTHTKLLPYYHGIASMMPVAATLMLIFTLGNLSLPLTPGFIGEMLCLIGINGLSELLVYVFCSTQVLGAIYSLWAYNRLMFGMSTGFGNNSISDLSRLEVSMVLPLLLGSFWLGMKPAA